MAKLKVKTPRVSYIWYNPNFAPSVSPNHLISPTPTFTSNSNSLSPAMKFHSVMKPEEVCFKKTNTQAEKQKQSEEESIFKAKLVAAAAAAASLLPIAPTPERNTEKAFFSSDSPLTWADHDTLDESAPVAVLDLDSSPRTPKAAVFDPFAPGPDDLNLAPRLKKFTIKSKIDVVRRLNFEDCKQDEVADLDEEEVFLGKIYESLLDAIVAKQIEGVLGEGLFGQKIESCATPNGMPLLNGIAETCPGAPKKFRSVLKKKDLGLCRKLQF